MKKHSKLFFLLYCIAWFSSAPAQTPPMDSLKRIMFDKSTLPAQRRQAREEFYRLQREQEQANYKPTPQELLIKDGRTWLHQTEAGQDTLIEQLSALVLSDTVATMGEKETAIALLAQSRNPKAYAFLIAHFTLEIPYSRADENAFSTKAIFWYLHKDATGNWALFPEIIKLLSSQRLSSFDILPLTLLLDQIVQDPPFLIALLNLYAQKDRNEIFIDNKARVVQSLQDIH